jgi:uncharacterized protein
MNQIIDDSSFETARSHAEVKTFFAKVYAFMFGALLVSGLIAYQYGTEEFIFTHLYQVKGNSVSPTGLMYVLWFAPVGVALLMQTMLNRLSFAVLFMLFALYSVMLGFALASIFVVFSIGSIVGVFAATSAAFGIMAVMGYVTKVDLTRFGSLLIMGALGIVVAGFVNLWLHSDTLEYIVSMIGVLVFTGLTAYFMQNLKAVAQSKEYNEDTKNKLALIGGFQLYITFINLFLSLLSLFGERD